MCVREREGAARDFFSVCRGRERAREREREREREKERERGRERARKRERERGRECVFSGTAVAWVTKRCLCGFLGSEGT